MCVWSLDIDLVYFNGGIGGESGLRCIESHQLAGFTCSRDVHGEILLSDTNRACIESGVIADTGASICGSKHCFCADGCAFFDDNFKAEGSGDTRGNPRHDDFFFIGSPAYSGSTGCLSPRGGESGIGGEIGGGESAGCESECGFDTTPAPYPFV